MCSALSKAVGQQHHRWSYKVLIATGAIALLCSGTLARASTIDQSNTSFTPSLFQNVGAYYPMGQSFTASAPQLTFVHLSIAPEYGASLTVQIRSGSISGPILGTSALVTTNAGPIGSSPLPIPFSFPELVHLTVGGQFVIAVIPGNGESSGLVGSSGGPFSSYAGGDQILGEIAQPGNDLWFDEGSDVPEPSTCLLLFLGCSFVLGVRQRRRFRFGN
jgi:hypothetical protein